MWSLNALSGAPERERVGEGYRGSLAAQVQQWLSPGDDRYSGSHRSNYCQPDGCLVALFVGHTGGALVKSSLLRNNCLDTEHDLGV